jgi:hypothetical protein
MRTKEQDLADFNNQVRLEALYLTLEDRSFLDKRDLDTLRRFGIRCEGPHNWPCFRSMVTGLLPDLLNGSECQTMIHLLEQTLLIAERAESDKSFLIPMYFDDKSHRTYVPIYLTRFATVQDGELVWQETYMEAEMDRPVYPVIKLNNEEELDSLRRLPVLDSRKLEIDLSYVNLAIRGSDGERSYHPLLMTVIDEDGVILVHELIKSIDKEITEVFNRLLNYMRGTQSRPGQILTCREEVFQLLKQLCEQLDIRLVRLPKLKKTPYVVEQLLYDKTVAQICLHWSLQMGFLPLPKSANPDRIRENAAIFDFELSAADVAALAAIPAR